jgi:alpha-L-rhamnosidase
VCFRFVAALFVVTSGGLAAGLRVDKLRCEYLSEPLGIEATQPRLSWLVNSPERGEKQTAYQILVASSPAHLAREEGDLWDSGRVASDATHQISYRGESLSSRTRCYWKVRSWDREGEPSEWSEPAMWTMGLLTAEDWKARWIDAETRLPDAEVGGEVQLQKAFYETVDGEVSVEVTSQLQDLAKEGEFALPVENESFGGDPAYGTVKRLWVDYTIDGVKAAKLFAEKETFRYPAQLTAPPEIQKASYEAVDGSGSLDVTERLQKLAEKGIFSLAVDNDSMGSDPAFKQLKHLQVNYCAKGKDYVKTMPEGATLQFPSDLEAPAIIPYLRKTFQVEKSIAHATVYATALGIYELRLNGERVGEAVLAPEWTEYDERLRYQAYDVSSQLAAGENVLGAQVANGWYSGHIGNGGYQYWGTSPALLTQLEITYEDGSRETVITDSSWKSHPSPLVATDFMLGEDYDARTEMPGWDEPDYDDSDWLSVLERTEPDRELDGQVMEVSREVMELEPIALTEPAPQKWTYDLGQNMVGVVRLKISEPKGTRITLRHGEMLNPDGTLYTANLHGAPSIDTYICKGGGEEVWQPKFTFHGFRYVELTGVSEKPPLDAVTGVVIASDTPQTGKFITSDEKINQLQSNIEWGQRGNYLSVPTDCPQRDERLGWMGDAQVFVKTATYNADVAAFFTKWLVDVTDSQLDDGRFADVSPYAGPSYGTPAWGDAGVICPWILYKAYGDEQLLARQYPSMVKWVGYSLSESEDYIRSGDRGSDYGDWLSIGADTDKELIGTAYFAYSAQLVSEAATALGKKEDAERFEDLFQSIKKAFIKKYVRADGQIHGDTQCTYLMALKFDLLPEELRAAAADRLEERIEEKDGHLSTGFVGVSYLLPELTKAGKLDLAYSLLHQETFPSWLFSINMGATTIWERWDGWTPENGFQNVGMNSFNHYSLGSCGEWLYETVAGIQCAPEAVAFKEIVIRPRPGGKLTWVEGEYESINGLITSKWKKEDESFTLETTIPTNTTATIHVPAREAASVSEGGQPAKDSPGLTFLRMEDGAAVFAAESGRYHFTSKD